MDDAGFILASYGITLGSVGLYAWFLLRRARRVGRVAKVEELPWT